MKTNTKTGSNVVTTHEGAPARRITPEQELRRSVMSCMLFEGEFYENGVSIAVRIHDLLPVVAPEKVSSIAIEARKKSKLRHIPLLIVREMARLDSHKHLVADTLESVIQRPDELTEFLSMYFKTDKKGSDAPLSAQVKKGLARAFPKFSEYSLQKYNRDADVKLRDVLFLTHPTPKDEEQAAVWKRLAENSLKTPDTWEVALSGGADKKETFTRLIEENKLGALAMLRNLRNMLESGVSDDVIRRGLVKMDIERVLPFRFVSAARYAPKFEPELEQAMFHCLSDFPKLKGKTMLVLDNSGSMYMSKISTKSDLTRADAASALAMLLREICEEVEIISFSRQSKIVAPRRGFALQDVIQKATEHGATHTDDALKLAEKEGYDRIIVLTDEQSHQTIRNPASDKGYFINVASYQHGIGYGKWLHVDGFSESAVNFIVEYEKEFN